MNKPVPTTSGTTSFAVWPVGRVLEERDGDLQIIEIDPQYEAALSGIDERSHLWVLFWFDRQPDRETLQAHPRGDTTRPRQGVFSLRSPMRPNLIGLTRVQLRRVSGRRLFVQGLDALPGTPIIDLKPATEGAPAPD